MISICGIFGFAGKPTKSTPKIIRHLGELNLVRGRDSTGIALIDSESVVLQKDIVTSEVFFKDNEVNHLLASYKKKPFSIIMGHTRAATHGAVTVENAHPFIQKDFIFSHNGVIRNFYELQHDQKTDYEVDSMMIGHMINLEGIKGFDKLSGYFTTPYVSRNEADVLRIAVHNNILSYAYKDNQLYYSSRLDHLKEALRYMVGFTFKEVEQYNSDIVLSFYLVNNHITIATEKISPLSYSYQYPEWWRKKSHSDSKSLSGSAYSDEFGYDDYEYEDNYCLYGDNCKNKKDHKKFIPKKNNFFLPGESEWTKMHKLKTSKECDVLRLHKYCYYKESHELMDKLEKEYGDALHKEEVTKKLYREKYSKKKADLKKAIVSLQKHSQEEVKEYLRR